MGGLSVSGFAAPPAGRAVGPSSFGRVFARHRSALVRVKARTTWSTGFLIGANGEFVFGLDEAPKRALRVRTEDGEEHEARLLGFDRTLSLAVGIVDGLGRAPIPAGPPSELRPETWVVILGHDPKGLPSPHAGVVAKGPERQASGHVASVVDVPGAPGCPVLSADGALVGIAVARGRRRTRVVPLDYVAPFLERVVLGGRRD